MNLLGRYVTSRSEDLAKFRRDVHNILDRGILANKVTCEDIVQMIMKRTKHEETEQGNDDVSGFSIPWSSLLLHTTAARSLVWSKPAV